MLKMGLINNKSLATVVAIAKVIANNFFNFFLKK